jgi:hypothetical protein
MNAILEKEYKKYRSMDEAEGDIILTDSLVDKIHWESNSLVKINPNIPTDRVIKKTTTDKFPANAITVRFIRMKDKVVTVYFYGQSKVLNHGSGSNKMTWRTINQKLHVTLPFKGWHGDCLWGYSFMGNLPDNFTLDEMVNALEHIKEEVDRMTGN